MWLFLKKTIAQNCCEALPAVHSSEKYLYLKKIWIINHNIDLRVWFFNSQTVSPLRGQWELWGFAAWRSEHLDNSPWPPPMSSQEFCMYSLNMYLLNKVDASRLGAVEVCVYVTNQAPPCDLDVPPPTLREKSDTRHQSKNMQLGARTPPFSCYYH